MDMCMQTLALWVLRTSCGSSVSASELLAFPVPQWGVFLLIEQTKQTVADPTNLWLIWE